MPFRAISFRSIPCHAIRANVDHTVHLKSTRPVQSIAPSKFAVLPFWNWQGMIKATCLVLHHHICEGCLMSWPIDSRFNIFNDPPGMDAGHKNVAHRSRNARSAHGRREPWGVTPREDQPPPSYAEVTNDRNHQAHCYPCLSSQPFVCRYDAFGVVDRGTNV